MKHLLTSAVLGVASASCVKVPIEHADAMAAVPRGELGEDRIAFKWKFVSADHLIELDAQEFAAGVVFKDTVYFGSASGWFYAVRAATGVQRWRKQIGSVSTAPLVYGGTLYVGTSTGLLLALDDVTGKEKWRYQSHGGIEQPPNATGDLIIFSNAVDQVIAIEASTGKFKWQYKSPDVPDEYTLRGHAGVTIDGDLVYTGFANGNLVALRKDTGSVAWSASLKGDADRFVDVDATPIVLGDRVYASSSSGGVFSLDKTTGFVRWRVPFYDVRLPSSTGNVGGIATDGKTIYVSVADLGTYAIDLSGNVIWRVGAKGGGEPGTPVIYDDLLLYSLAGDGLFFANRKTGATVEYFDPGDGVSAQPTIADGQLFVMSNRGVLYAFDLE